MTRAVVAAGAGIWQIIVWGSRIVLMDDRADIGGWIRIVAGIGLGLWLLAATVRPDWHDGRLAAAFAIFCLTVWVPSAWRVLASDASGGFKAVHTVLALGSFAWVLAVRQTTTSTHTAAKSKAR